MHTLKVAELRFTTKIIILNLTMICCYYVDSVFIKTSKTLCPSTFGYSGKFQGTDLASILGNPYDDLGLAGVISEL